MYTHIDLAVVVIFTPSSVMGALQLPMLEVCSSDTPSVDIFGGTGLMEMFLRTMGSFSVFSGKLDWTVCLPVRFQFV